MLWAIRLRTPGGIPAWVGPQHVAFIGPVAGARKFSLPADAFCYMESFHERMLPGFAFEVEPISDRDHWEEPPPTRKIVPFALEVAAAAANGRATA